MDDVLQEITITVRMHSPVNREALADELEFVASQISAGYVGGELFVGETRGWWEAKTSEKNPIDTSKAAAV